MTDRRSDRPNLLAVAALPAAAAAALLLWLTTAGLALSSDSVQYLSAGRSLIESGRLSDVAGDPLTAWPPLLPAIAAGFLTAGLDPIDAFRFLNAATFAALAGVVGASVYRSTGRRVLAVAAALALVAHPWLAHLHAHLWSEPLFVLWVALALVNARSLAWLTLFTALACLTRYVGISLVPVGVAALLLDGRRAPAARLRRAGAYVALGLAPLLAWAARNWSLGAGPFGARSDAIDPVATVASHAALRLVESVAPYRVALALPGAAWAAALAAAWLVALYLARRKANSVGALSLLWAGSYLALFVAAAARTAVDDASPRLLAPVLVALALAVPLIRVPAGVVAAALAAAAAVGIQHDGRLWQDVRRHDPHSLRAVARHSGGSEGRPLPAATLVSNRPDALYLMTGRASRLSPRRTPYRSGEAVAAADLARLAKTAAAGPTALVWFHDVSGQRLLPLETVRQRVRLEPLERPADPGVPAFSVYLVTPELAAAK